MKKISLYIIFLLLITITGCSNDSYEYVENQRDHTRFNKKTGEVEKLQDDGTWLSESNRLKRKKLEREEREREEKERIEREKLHEPLAKDGWITDYANLLSQEDKSRLSAYLSAYEKETCHQIYLLIIPSLGNDDIAEFSQKTAKAWEIGQPGFGNGFLVIIAMQEGTVRIETGSAFEWFIQDGSADKVLKEVMFPLFRQERFVEGIERGLDEIMTAGRLKTIPENYKPDVCRK